MTLIKRRYFILSLVVLAVLGLWLVRGNQLTSAKVSLSEPFATNIQYPHAEAPGKLRFFSGTAFVEYDRANHTTRALTRLFALPSVSEMYWSASGAIFYASGYSPVDELSTVLESQQLPLDQPYWWKVDFATNQIALVGEGTGVRNAIWIHGSDDYLYDQETETGHRLYLVKHNQPPRDLGLVQINRLIWASHDRVVVLTDDSRAKQLKLLTLTGLKQSLLDDNVMGDVAVSADGRIAYLDRPKKPTADEHEAGELVVLSSDGPSQIIARDFAGNFGWDSSGQTLIAYSYDQRQQGFKLIEQPNGSKSKVWEFRKPSHLTLKSLTVTSAQPSELLITDSQDQLYQISSQNTALPQLAKPEALQKDTIYQPGFKIYYHRSRNQYEIEITQNPYRQTQQHSLDYIKGLGLDPYQLRINWYPSDGIDRSG